MNLNRKSNILFFGDSHVGAFIEAQKEYTILEGSVDFFGAAQPHLLKEEFNFEGSIMRPNTEKVINTFSFTGGSEQIDFSQYDICFLVGWFADPIYLFNLIQEDQSFYPLKLYQKKISHHLISDDIYFEILTQSVIENFDLYEKIRDIFKGTIYIIPKPLPDERSPDNFHRRRLTDNKIKYEIYNDFVGFAEAKCRRFNASFIQQPYITLSDRLFTKTEFSRKSRKIIDGTNHPIQECTHMNKEYGKLFLEKLKMDYLY